MQGRNAVRGMSECKMERNVEQVKDNGGGKKRNEKKKKDPAFDEIKIDRCGVSQWQKKGNLFYARPH